MSTAKMFACNNIAPATEGRCGFFVKRKQRYCKMLPTKNQNYCAEHICEDDNEVSCESKKRIPCPIDPKHTVYEDRLEKHLKKCNAVTKLQLPYFTKDINIGIKNATQSSKVTLCELSCDELNLLIEKVRSMYNRISGTVLVTEMLELHNVLNKELNNKEYSDKLRKQLLQQASLVNILEKMGALKDRITIIEFGAGKGALSHWMQKAIGDKSDCKFFLVDRHSNRNRLDCYHKGDEQGPRFERLNIDIQHLNLGNVATLNECSNEICAVGKHLCGGATDLSLRCLFESTQSHDAESSKASKKPRLSSPLNGRVRTCLFALCCYHRCTWSTYTGREALSRDGFTEVDFHRVAKMASWSTCGFRKRAKHNNDATEKTTSDHVIQDDLDRCKKLNLSSLEQEEIGRMCKRIIDYGRVEYVRWHGYDAELVRYIPQSITPENIALKVTVMS